MEEITIVDTEVVEDTSEVIVETTEVEEVTVDEILSVQEEETIATTVAYDDTVLIEMMTEIRGDMRILVLLSILTFCSACLRGWRNNVIKGAR